MTTQAGAATGSFGAGVGVAPALVKYAAKAAKSLGVTGTAAALAPVRSVTMDEAFYGRKGVAQTLHGYHTFDADIVGQQAYVGVISAGSRLLFATMVTEALGTSVTLNAGFQHIDHAGGDSNSAFFSAVDGDDAAVFTGAPSPPVVLTHDAYITVTVGGGAATGRTDLVVFFVPAFNKGVK